jgi:hypothetical protein
VERLDGAARRAGWNRLASRLERDARTAADPARVRAMAAAARELGRPAR